ncbi:3,4-dihydroxy-2-butanone-4-phosphate synthase [Acidianus brierleyi]|uniref:3,4-dihydroxy-2-butanone 4-phosphate synthase n=1 Tax=Acidianus brierleyi TaxID=41673 RepID=A0A2U9IF09_9CREN|nr:3,4-dihydroxy-2-butanone-4-phosphate synthase [Acidianus brierleyi]AWR94524.1 3,4-dihydroxy-2-butanone 4-phosphate synthase [Acidianus brierleyi]
MISKEIIRKNLESGLPILIYDFDGREEETDMIFYAGAINWKSIYTLRTSAGGLICYATGSKEANILGLRFQTDILRDNTIYKKLVKIPSYKDEPAFSIWVNHVNTTTGISDYDRAKTIQELHKVIITINENPLEAKENFYTYFYAPGHVPFLISRDITKRRGHTELSTTLMSFLGLEKSVAFAEMLDEKVSLKKNKALLFAKNNGLLFIEGKEILNEVIA